MFAGSFPRQAKAANPVKFSGWTFKPDTVKDYVDFYNKTYNAQVQYEPIPWPQYHPTMETRAFAGEVGTAPYGFPFLTTTPDPGAVFFRVVGVNGCGTGPQE